LFIRGLSISILLAVHPTPALRADPPPPGEGKGSPSPILSYTIALPARVRGGEKQRCHR
jgi:hypothetical protein